MDGWLDQVKDATAEELEQAAIPGTDTSALQESAFRLVASSYMLGLIHAAEEEPGKSLADDIIPPVPFAEAVKFLAAKIPLAKAEWEKLEPRIRFRAFTVALLGAAHEIAAAQQLLARALEDGSGYAETWYRLKDKVAAGESLTPGYWENVYRTNTQSAYIAGKLDQYQGSGVAAYQLMVIEDNRTTPICRNLLNQASGYGAVIPVEDKFWQTNGFPPYHYQCRTSIRGVWPSQLRRIRPDTRQTAPDIRNFEPMAGFGGNPAKDGLWWEETASQRKQAEAYGVQGMIDAARESLSLSHTPKVIEPGKNFDRKERVYTDQEDLAAVNPNFSPGSYEYSMNCQRCVATWELRRRGYRVTALPATDPDELAQNWTSIFSNMKPLRCKTENEIAEIKRQMRRWGDGARAEIYVRWKNRAVGHVFVAEQKNGRTYFYDPQSADKAVGKYFSDCIKGFTSYTRIDTLKVTDLILKCCTNQ